MKILDVKVDDPGRRGYANKPTLKVWVDERPAPSGEIIRTDVVKGHYLHRHHGPFVKFLFYASINGGGGSCGDPQEGFPLGAWSSRAGAFNVEVKPTKQVMDVTMYVGKNSRLGYADMALEIDRAARELKKHDPDWYLVVDADAAKQGDITWRPEELIPSCLWRGKNSPAMAGDPAPCLKVAYHPYNGRAQGLCDDHKVAHDQHNARIRAEQAAKYPTRR